MRENRILVLPVNILTVWRAGFTWPHDTPPCVLMHYSGFSQFQKILLGQDCFTPPTEFEPFLTGEGVCTQNVI